MHHKQTVPLTCPFCFQFPQLKSNERCKKVTKCTAFQLSVTLIKREARNESFAKNNKIVFFPRNIIVHPLGCTSTEYEKLDPVAVDIEEFSSFRTR